MLRAIINAEGDACTNAIIFCNRKVDVDIVAKSLKTHGYNAEPIHGDLDQSHRMRTLDGFRDGSIKFLVASDVAARGLDIPNVSHVLNYDVPGHAEDYVHRIGRTGRAGRKGTTIMMAVPSDDKLLAAIETLIGQPVPRIDAPWQPTAGAASRRKPSDEDKPAEDKPARSRSRSRSRKSEDKPEEPQTAAEPQAEATPEPRPERKEPRRKPDTSRSRSGGGGGRRGGNQIVGMGDHMPDFIALSFAERRGGPARPAEATQEPAESNGDDESETAA